MATTVKLDDALKARISALAESRKRSAHWIMREAITEYVAREEARDSFRAEAHQSWRDYRETGRHISADEAERWLGSWGTEDEQDAPECHD